MEPTPTYTLTRRRMRHVRMVVRPGTGEVRVSAPHRTPLRDIEAWVRSKSDWIEAEQARARTLAAPLAPGPEADALRAELEPLLGMLVERWVPAMGVPWPEWKTRIMRSRWGSCNSVRRTITFNLELAREPERLVEYVVVHELAHLLARNHGPGFQALMDVYLPEWRELRRELNARNRR